jgi:hypothetical protein
MVECILCRSTPLRVAADTHKDTVAPAF